MDKCIPPVTFLQIKTNKIINRKQSNVKQILPFTQTPSQEFKNAHTLIVLNIIAMSISSIESCK